MHVCIYIIHVCKHVYIFCIFVYIVFALIRSLHVSLSVCTNVCIYVFSMYVLVHIYICVYCFDVKSVWIGGGIQEIKSDHDMHASSHFPPITTAAFSQPPTPKCVN